MKYVLLAVVALMCCRPCCLAEELPQIRDAESPGVELGVSALFAGVVQGKLLVAGGCNFPDVPAAQGGKKRFYDGIYALTLNQSSAAAAGWQRVGTLPHAMAYGAFVEWEGRLICIGGQTPEGATDEVFALRLEKGRAVVEMLPSLPCRLDNAYAALLDEVVYVAGGNADGVPSDVLLALALRHPEQGWTRVATLPDGPRLQPVLAALRGRLYLMGGFCNRPGETPHVCRTAWSFDVTDKQWMEMAAPPAFVGGGCAVVLDEEHLLCAGGVNADRFERAIRGEYTQPDYLLHPREWYRFNSLLQCYHVEKGIWTCMAEDSRLARAGAALVATTEDLFMIQGEEKPGIRSPQMLRYARHDLERTLPVAESLPLLPRPQHIVFCQDCCKGDSLTLTQQVRVELVPPSALLLPHSMALGLVNGQTADSLHCADEAYVLDVSSSEGICIRAVSEQGVKWARQTLAQLAIHDEEGHFAGFMGCHVEDWPSFRIRGFLQDVGRSYISLTELKREIDLLSRFKVNVFHWHLTENQAWRLESKCYPQLNDPAITLRMPGKYYTHAEARELVDYCRERGVTLIPEIDVPGHSAAFERAFGCTMQSEQGVPIVRDLLNEACDLFHDLPYLHLGTDEVAFTNPDFVPQMVALVRSKGLKVISYNPGWRYQPGEIDMTHLWSYRGKAQPGIPAIDSKFHYLNHFDTFADLVALYASRIYNTPHGNDQVAGAILALWHDRLSPTEPEMIRNNHLYPCMLALAERAWRGGGEAYFDGLGTMLPPRGSKDFLAFADFERRMIDHLEHGCAPEEYCYVRQQDQVWVVTDAFPNEGNLNAVFPPEQQPLPRRLQDARFPYNGATYGVGTATGAGLYLRHVWGTLVPGFYAHPEPNQTAYAYTWVYSDREQQVGLLAETQNYSRSEKDFPPQQGTWDYCSSRIWLNGTEVAPPHWTNQTMVHDNELPLGNENLAVRQPIPVTLYKGWNTLLLKLPVGQFTSPEVRLVKWMFAATFTTPDGRRAAPGIRYAVECVEE